MKKNKKILLSLGLILMIECIIGYSVSSTYAKYASILEGNSSARVAKWSWNINSISLSPYSNSLNINNLFSAGKIYELNNDVCSENVDDDVKQNGDALVAPGTCGKTIIDIFNNSEVNATYLLNFVEINNSNIPIKYSLTGSKDSWKTISEINDAISSDGAKRINMGKSSTIYLYWKWDFNDGNYSDTSYGFNGNDTINIKATLNLSQVD